MPKKSVNPEDEHAIDGKLENEEFLEGEVNEVESNIEEDERSLKEQVAELNKALEAEKEQSDKYLKNWQYTQADLENYRKQVAKERQSVQEQLKANALRSYLDILDDVERCLQHLPEEEDGNKWAGGIELIYRKMLTYLESEGVARIETSGEFDPLLHEAISSEPSEQVPSGHIIGVVQTGYRIGNRVLRPARVRVAI